MARPNQEERKMTPDNVYFDPRKAIAQEAEDIKKAAEEMTEEEKRLANIALGGAIVGQITKFFVAPAVIMLVWNLTMPALGVTTIGYFTSIGLYVIAKILFND